MIILGIDPGIAIVGYGIVEFSNQRFKTIAYGAITTKPDVKTYRRYEIIYDELEKLIKMFNPDDVAIEEIFFNTNQKTIIQVSQARGVILLCATHNKLNIFEYTPLQVKQSVVGYGRADKKQVIFMVKDMLNLKTDLKLDDTADALAIAVCHAHTGTSVLKKYYNIK